MSKPSAVACLASGRLICDAANTERTQQSFEISLQPKSLDIDLKPR